MKNQDSLQGAIVGEAARHYAGLKKWAGIMYRGIAATIGRSASRGRFLEMGAGPGFLAVMLAVKYPGITFTLADLSPDMADIAGEHISKSGADASRFSYAVGDVCDRGFVESLGQFDCVYSTFSLHHWQEPEAALDNLWRVVAPGGVLVIHDFRRIGWLAALSGNGGMGKSVKRSFKPEELRKLLQQSGAADITVRTPVFSVFQTVTAWKQ